MYHQLDVGLWRLPSIRRERERSRTPIQPHKADAGGARTSPGPSQKMQQCASTQRKTKPLIQQTSERKPSATTTAPPRRHLPPRHHHRHRPPPRAPRASSHRVPRPPPPRPREGPGKAPEGGSLPRRCCGSLAAGRRSARGPGSVVRGPCPGPARMRG